MVVLASLLAFFHFGIVAIAELLAPLDDDFCLRPRFASADETKDLRITTSYTAWPPRVTCRYVGRAGRTRTISGPRYPRVALTTALAVTPPLAAVWLLRRRRS